MLLRLLIGEEKEKFVRGAVFGEDERFGVTEKESDKVMRDKEEKENWMKKSRRGNEL